MATSTQPPKPANGGALAITGPSLIRTFADRYGVEPSKLQQTLKKTIFPQEREASDEQVIMFLIVANKYELNPFTKEIYAFPSKGGIVPIVSIDGWLTIINRHSQLDGIEFKDQLDGDGTLESIVCRIYRKDRSKPIEVAEYMDECKRPTEPWQKWPRRMLRHKALIQCARVAFSLSGIYDHDEAERIIEAELPIIQRSTVPELPAEIRRASDTPREAPAANQQELREQLALSREISDLLTEISSLDEQRAAELSQEAKKYTTIPQKKEMAGLLKGALEKLKAPKNEKAGKKEKPVEQPTASQLGFGGIPDE